MNYAKSLFKLSIGLLIALGGPLGAPLFFYGFLLLCSKSKTGDFHIIDTIARATSLVESLFESLPQITLQIFENVGTNWEHPFKYASICFSGLGILYTLYKLCDSLDKSQQFQTAASLKVKPDLGDSRAVTMRRENIMSKTELAIRVNDENDVYEGSNDY